MSSGHVGKQCTKAFYRDGAECCACHKKKDTFKTTNLKTRTLLHGRMPEFRIRALEF